jgi:plastocyanin
MNNIPRKISLFTLLMIITIFFTACGGNASNSQAGSDATNDYSTEQEQAAPADTSAVSTSEEAAADTPAHDMNSEDHSDMNSEASPETPPEKPAESPTDTPAESAEPAAAESVSENHVVEITNFAFAPAKLTIKPGDTITFINKDPVKHTATAGNKSFDTGLIGQDEEVQIAFDKAGEFSYYCAPHPAMRGSIIVKDAD